MTGPWFARAQRSAEVTPKTGPPAKWLGTWPAMEAHDADDDEIEAAAQEYVRREYPGDCEILWRQKRSEPDGIHFRADDPLAPKDGMGTFFVHRESGEVWLFGWCSPEGEDYWMKRYAEAWPSGSYRLTVREVASPDRLARILVAQHVTYPTPEVEHDTVTLRDVEYDEELVLRRLKELPCSFGLAC